jgi:hypothetical protein
MAVVGSCNIVKKIALILVLVTGLAVTACSTPGSATQPQIGGKTSSITLELTEAELVAQANLIVVGVVREKKSQWDANHKNIYTLVTVSVEELIKGQSSNNSIIVNVPGGEVAGIAQWVEDTPSFQVGDRALFFLKQRSDSTFTIIGGGQGVYRSGGIGLVEPTSSFADTVSRIKSLVSKGSK